MSRKERLIYEHLKENYGITVFFAYKPFDRISNYFFIGMEAARKKLVFVKLDRTGGEASAREAALLQLLQPHTGSGYFPNLIAYDAEGRYPFVALEFIEGISLAQLMAQRRSLPSKQKQEMVRQMAEISTILRQANVIHRDIRPANIMFQSGEAGKLQLTLIDFGFSLGLAPLDLPELPFLIAGELLPTLGDGYKPDDLTWDDAYSFLIIAHMIDADCYWRSPDKYAKLLSQLNTFRYSHT
ncbi:protein kinase domain-containing protein [Paenibacillus sp. y28]|uniref:protein kinase domain-containing protein n=1 Tax=Paenibacillus sp. y28 TaxID=3129110 RepID=UPI003016DB22